MSDYNVSFETEYGTEVNVPFETIDEAIEFANDAESVSGDVRIE